MGKCQIHGNQLPATSDFHNDLAVPLWENHIDGNQLPPKNVTPSAPPTGAAGRLPAWWPKPGSLEGPWGSCWVTNMM